VDALDVSGGELGGVVDVSEFPELRDPRFGWMLWTLWAVVHPVSFARLMRSVPGQSVQQWSGGAPGEFRKRQVRARTIARRPIRNSDTITLVRIFRSRLW